MTAKEKPKTYVGIDYSMSSPAIAIYNGYTKNFHWRDVEFHYYTTTESLAKNWFRTADEKSEATPWCRGYTTMTVHPNNEERFLWLSKWAFHVIHNSIISGSEVVVALEDYALGGRGRVFEIAENTGCLKQMLRAADYDFRLYAPTAVKKFASGKGNSDKDAMYAAWLKETEYFDIWKQMTPGRGKISGPVTDIVDAYYILKKLITEEEASAS